eukprot:c14153_g1_i2.p1 GENE.c14153_g1_i2~~c14153_g1_i2.p1  ORF type:complete len:110 (+),score=4.74 c14153_g1_i2:266-595(+)
MGCGSSRPFSGGNVAAWIDEKRPVSIEHLLSSSSDLSDHPRLGRSPLCAAAAHGLERVGRELLAHGCELFRTDRSGHTPAEMAQRYHQQSFIRMIDSYQDSKSAPKSST